MAEEASAPVPKVTTVYDQMVADANARKSIAEANAAEVKALLPTLPATLPSESLDVPDAGSPIGGAAAHKALTSCTYSIAERIFGLIRDKQVWIVTDDTNVRWGAVADGLDAQITQLDTAVDDVLGLLGADPAAFVSAVVGAISLAASALGPLISLFKTDRTIRNRDVTIGETALVAAMANHIRLLNDNVPIRCALAGISPLPDGPFSQKITDLRAKRQQLVEAVLAFESDGAAAVDAAKAAERLAMLHKRADLAIDGKVEWPDSLVGDAETAAGDVATHTQASNARTAVAAAARTAITAIDSFLTAVTTPNDQGVTPVAAANAYRSWATGEDRVTLRVEVSFSGAESRYEEKLLGDDRANHLGAVCVSFALFDHTGALLRSAIVPAVATATASISASSPISSWLVFPPG